MVIIWAQVNVNLASRLTSSTKVFCLPENKINTILKFVVNNKNKNNFKKNDKC